MYHDLETLVKSISLCHKSWWDAFNGDCPELCDELEKLKMNFFNQYQRCGGKALQIGDLISFKGEITWTLEDELMKQVGSSAVVEVRESGKCGG